MDVIAQRYGVLPSDAASKDNDDFMFNLLVASVGIGHEQKQQKKAADKARSARRR